MSDDAYRTGYGHSRCPGRLLVAGDTAPSFTGPVADQTYTLGEATTLTLPATRGGNVTLLNGNSSLSPEMVLRVEKAFGLSMDLLLRMQAWHDATQMRARADEIDLRRYQPA